MPSLWDAAFSSSSSSNDSPKKVKKGSKSFGWSFKSSSSSSSSSKRRLTRQRKLRHVTDEEIGLRRPLSLPVSPDYGGGSRLQHRWTKSAMPQPLPLPEVNSHNFPLPREGSSKVDGDNSLISGITRSNEQTLLKSPDNTTRKSPRTPTYQRRGFFQGLNVGGIKPVFRLNVPARSAPGSGLSSPILSPKRFSSGELFQSSQRASVSEASPLDMVSGSSHTSTSKITASCEHSPSDSPNICNRNSVQHSHHKSLPENNVSRHDSTNTHLHRLPLPPGVSRPSQSSFSHHHMDKSETPTVKGQWQKGKLIGRGTFGSVYEATHRETGALCAMKEVDFIPDDPKCAESIKQLEQEIKVLRQLKHPNIVQYYGSEIIGDRFCIYLEYVHPGSINKYVREHCGAMTECIVRNFTRHILSGLAYLHSTKTIHRDIKGANLLVNASGVVKLADFGLAKHLTGTAINLSLKGSPHWMAPEVLQAAMRNDSKPDHACAIDLWSLGCTVIEMLTGKPPWSEFDGVQAMFNVLNKTPRIPETLSLEGKDFLKKCLQRDPTDRPSAVELLDHPFLHNIRDQHVPIFREEFSGIRLHGTPNCTRDSTKHSNDHVMHERLPSNGEISARSSPGHSDFRAAPCHSPRSTLEILPCISSPELNGSSSFANASNAHNGLIAKAGTNPLSLRNHERQILYF